MGKKSLQTIDKQKIVPIAIKAIGFALLMIGLLAAYYGPMEWFVYTFFTEGGPFHYDGFGMGSAWFGGLVVLNSGYYLIAILCLPLAIGHLKLRRWTVTLSRLYLWFWLGAGVLLMLNILLLMPQAVKLNLIRAIPAAEFFALLLSIPFLAIILPNLGLWFYGSEEVRSLFYKHDPHKYWIDKHPFPLLAVLLILVIMIIVLHYAIFFQGIFPMFGQIWLGRQPVYLISVLILAIGFLMYGITQLKRWAWWGSLLVISALAISTLLSFSRYSFHQIMLMMKLPEYEMDLLNQMTLLHEYRPAALLTPPLLAVVGLLIFSMKYFGKGMEFSTILRKYRRSLRKKRSR